MCFCSFPERSGDNNRYGERGATFERKVEKYDRREESTRYEPRRDDFHRSDRDGEDRRLPDRGFDRRYEVQHLIAQAWELYAHGRIYAPVKFPARPNIYPVCPKA